MKTVITLPRDLEVRGIKIDQEKGTIEIDHRPIRGSTPVVYLTATGTGGKQSRATVTVDQRDGRYSVVNDDEGRQTPFDLTPEEFDKRRAQQSARGRRSRNGGTQPPTAPKP